MIIHTTTYGKGEATKNSNEAKYSAIFDNLSDFLIVLFCLNWPATGLSPSYTGKGSAAKFELHITFYVSVIQRCSCCPKDK